MKSLSSDFDIQGRILLFSFPAQGRQCPFESKRFRPPEPGGGERSEQGVVLLLHVENGMNFIHLSDFWIEADSVFGVSLTATCPGGFTFEISG